MTGQPNPQDAWAPCEEGQLSSLASDLNRRTKSNAPFTAAKAMAACAVLVFAVGMLMRSGNPAPIACTAVGVHLADYARGDCPPELAEQIALHLESCEKCKQHLAKLKAEQTAKLTPPMRLAYAASAR